MKISTLTAERVLIAGDCRAQALVLSEPLSFWGGLDPGSGRIVDEHHPQCGATVTGCALVMPGTRGSTSSPGVLAESLRLGTGPAAIILPHFDTTILTAVVVVENVCELSIPVLVLRKEDFDALGTGSDMTIVGDQLLVRG